MARLLSLSILTLLISSASTIAHPSPVQHDHDHEHVARGNAVPEVMRGRNWMQDERSETARMFLDRRAGTVGSTEWVASYPPSNGQSPAASLTPQAWTDRYNALASNPNFPTSYAVSNLNGGYPTYPNGLKGTSPEVCSFTYECSEPNDLVNPAPGHLAIAFDDGPTANSHILYDFIEQNNISATHFMIGANILYQTDVVQRAVKDGGHIAVHTWSHQYMTTLTNAQVVAELGWTMQIITDVTGFVPAFWRPPYGDVDQRVRYIAAEVFGLYTVPWNRDSGDWAAGNDPAYTVQSVESQIETWLTGSKDQGLSILEHELSQNSITIFMASYPKMLSNGWQVANIADTYGKNWYQNAADDAADAGDSTAILQTAAVGELTAYYTANLNYNVSDSGSNSDASASSVNTTSSSSSSSSSSVASSSSLSSAASTGSAAGSNAQDGTTSTASMTSSSSTMATSAATNSARATNVNATSGALAQGGAVSGLKTLVMIGCGVILGAVVSM